MNMNDMIELQNEIDFLTKENNMLSQKVEALQRDNQKLELQIADLIAAYLEMRTKCTDTLGNH